MVLGIHNLLRWLVIVLAALALVMAFTGWLGKKEWKEGDRRYGVMFTGALDLQLLIGLVLYFALSPVTRGALSNMKAAMKEPSVRFFAVEHSFLMLVAVVLAHVGSVMVKKASNDSKFRTAAIWYTLSTLAILFAIPWWRPLMPGF
ncbi:MAG TPA: hypothetical protein V6D00_15285 [Pantanalinema sp.]